MKVNELLSNIGKVLKSNSPEILTGAAVTGVLSTSYLVGRASFIASDVIRNDEAIYGVSGDPRQRFKDRVKSVWRLYIPASVSGFVTVVCIIGSHKTNNSRTAAAVTAYSLTEKAFTEYKEKVVEELGKGKEQKLRDSIAQDNVIKAPTSEVVVVGTGHILCCELYTNRFFRSDMETLRKAQNDINYSITHSRFVTLEEFYDLIGLPHTSISSMHGWDSDRQLELMFSTVLSAAGEPCLAFDYNHVRPLK